MSRPAWMREVPDEEADALAEETVPGWTAPMLATLSHDTFSDPDWIYERKLDGERCLVFRDGGVPRIVSRNRKLLNDTYPELTDALGRVGTTRYVADGEIVAFDGNVTSFSRLQRRIGIRDADEARRTRVAVWIYLFDVLHLDGWRTTGLSQRTRKKVLKRAFDFPGRVRYLPHRNRDGERYHRDACRRGWEGVIAKDARAPYAHGRSKRWLKLKCGNRQELVIGGFTDPKGSRKGFGALLLGVHEDGELRYAGRVGTGFDDKLLQSLHARMRRIERKSAPFDAGDPPHGDHVHWVRPELVAEVGFTEWTRDARLRHPRFIGLRDDKDAKDVVRERPREA